MNLKKVPKWAWIAAGVVAVGVWWYMHSKSANSASNSSPGVPDNSTGFDDSQLSSDIASQLAAALGGTPADNSAYQGNDAALLQSLLQMLQDSQSEFGSLASQIYAGGITGNDAGQAAQSQLGIGATQPVTQAGQITPYVQSPAAAVAPAATFQPLYGSSGGVPFEYSPTAGSVFSTSTPAAAGYAALGVAPSAPITFSPVPVVNAPAPIPGGTLTAKTA